MFEISSPGGLIKGEKKFQKRWHSRKVQKMSFLLLT
jgi:hypothetical protein